MEREHHSNFQNWLLDHDPSDDMKYKQAWWDVYVFIRDKIIPMFDLVDKETYHKLHGEDYFKKKTESINSFVEVIGTHWSKSILHPVIKLTYKGVTFVIRYNFYDYEIAVIGDIPITLPSRLFYSKDEQFFYQGFPEEYQLKERYFDGAEKFMASVIYKHEFFTFMFLMRDIIDKYREENS